MERINKVKASRIVQWLYPENCACPLCGQEAALLPAGVCAACAPELVPPPRIDCPASLDGLVAGLVYGGQVENALRRFKYHGEVWRARFLASRISLPEQWKIDCMLPVPLHPFKQWKRTFNQSLLLAKALQRRYPLPIEDRLLRRVRNTPAQARLTGLQRLHNLDDAFRAGPGVKGRSILLIDDVTTTHATLIACAETLKRSGATHVYAACACLASRDTDKPYPNGSDQP